MRRLGAILLTCFACLSTGRAIGAVVGDLRCENLSRALAVDTSAPRFGWKLFETAGGEDQTHYRIQVFAGDTVIWDSGRVLSTRQVAVPYGGRALTSGEQFTWRVRVWTRRGASEWSSRARFGVGLIDPSAVSGEFIGSAGSGGTAVLLRKRFTIEDATKQALLHVNSLGYHEVWINGARVSEDVLSPAISQMNVRSLWVTHDVSGLLRKGSNEIVIWLGQGWYKKTTFGRWEEGEAYAEPLVRAQLDVSTDGVRQTVCATDDSWRAALSGYTDTGSWNALSFGGERVDARLNPTDMSPASLDALQWRPVMTAAKPQYTATPQMCEPNRIKETLAPVKIERRDDGRWFIDFGRVSTGWLELNLDGLSSGDEIRMEYSDEVDSEGNLLDQAQRDSYIARGSGSETFVNKFNHHAFRYVVVDGLTREPKAKAHRIHTDYVAASSFECSDADLNAVHDMVFYTMTCLAFSGYMVDCPHLERAGYGGDGNSSTQTLQTMYDVAPLYANWVQSWADAMRPGGSLPHVAPNAGAGGGGPYWCGFMVMAPYHTWQNYGDRQLVERFYTQMQEWFGYVDKYTVDGLLGRWPDTPYRDWFLGDWLAPAGVDSGNDESISLVNNCFISDCFGRMEQMATSMGRTDDARMYAAKRAALNRLLHERFFDPRTLTYATGSQLDMAYPMLVGATPPELYEKVSARFAELNHTRWRDHIGGGLFGVPIITRWAVENRAADWMATMLRQRDYPGYLYMIDRGATATWEYWSGERSRVHNCYNGIGTWFYQAVGGLRASAPGWQHVTIDPQIPEGVTWSRVSKETPYGTVRVNWELSGGYLTAEIELPSGVTADFKGRTLRSGKHSIRIKNL